MVMSGEWAQKDVQRAPGALTLPLKEGILVVLVVVLGDTGPRALAPHVAHRGSDHGHRIFKSHNGRVPVLFVPPAVPHGLSPLPNLYTNHGRLQSNVPHGHHRPVMCALSISCCTRCAVQDTTSYEESRSLHGWDMRGWAGRHLGW